jgi:hypothetical protein
MLEPVVVDDALVDVPDVVDVLPPTPVPPDPDEVVEPWDEQPNPVAAMMPYAARR